MWKTLDKKKNQGQRRKIIHYIKNWYKREEYQMIIIYIGDKKYIIDKKKIHNLGCTASFSYICCT